MMGQKLPRRVPSLRPGVFRMAASRRSCSFRQEPCPQSKFHALELWLGTEPGTGAQRFYEAAGWSFVQILPDGEALYELLAPRPGLAREPEYPPCAKN